MEVLQFVANDEVDPVYFETSYYVAAEETTAKPYALFMAALIETKQDAIAKVAMHNREHVVLIRPGDSGLILHTLYYSDELHKANRTETPKAQYSAKELSLATSLVKQLRGRFKPQDFTDTYRENVERLIAQKRKGQKVTTVREPRKAPVIDLVEALRRSLASSKRSGVGNGKKASPKRRAA